MERESPKRYMLVFEPMYAYCQYAIFFGSDSVAVTKTDKYTDKPLEGSKNKRVPKNLLSEIDLATAPLENLHALFDQYVDPKIFCYNGHNLHKIFIGYLYKDYMKSLRISINNPELVDKLPFVKETKINDYYGRQKMLHMIVDEKSRFVWFINHKKSTGDTSLSSYTIEWLNRLRECQNMMKYCPEEEINYEREFIEKKVDDELTYYRNYREMLLLKQDYLEFLDQEKSELAKKKKELMSPKVHTPSRDLGRQSDWGQLSMFDTLYPAEYPEEPKIKKY